jgi:arylformamidase
VTPYRTCRTAAEFDAGYANAITPDVVAHWEAWFRERSDAVLATQAPRIVAYGDDTRQCFDVFPAASGAATAPTLVAIHGGLWFLFDRWMMHFLVPAFTAAGVNVVCPSYRLAPARGLGEIVADCRAALQAVRRDGAALGIGTSRVSVLGHSAAGQLAAVLASPEDGGTSGPLAACIGVSGFYEIEPFAQTGFQPLVGFSAADYARWNPMRLVSPRGARTLLVTGGDESPWLHEMAEVYDARLRAAGAASSLLDVTGECHFSVLARLGDQGGPVHERVRALL